MTRDQVFGSYMIGTGVLVMLLLFAVIAVDTLIRRYRRRVMQKDHRAFDEFRAKWDRS